MEAVGFAASIYNLLELSERVITYIKDARGANEERKTLINELASTKVVLSGLESKADTDEWRSTMEALMTKNGPRDQFKSVLERLGKKLDADGRRVVKSLTWHFAKEEIKEILSQIERVKSLFVLALENQHM